MTDHNPALNASFLYNFGSQFKFGFWGSNIARLNNIDDNFWLKLVGEIKVDFHDKASMRFYIHDDHFYKADVRNGQSLGFILDYGFYTVQLEYLNNYQGSHTPAQYLNVGKSFLFKKGYIAGGKLGFTMLSASSFKDYFDAKAFGGYVFSEHTSVEAGITLTSDAGNVYGRGRPALYFAAELIY